MFSLQNSTTDNSDERKTDSDIERRKSLLPSPCLIERRSSIINKRMNLSEALRSDKFDELEKKQWSSRSSPNKGPKRLCIFCLLAIFLPILCLCIPLYMRHRALKPHLFSLSPSDMKLLNQESRVSTFWCQGQDIKMNGSFNAYLLNSRPKLKRFRHNVNMERRMILPDDVKEYWGFYLLKGSTVKVSVCSRYVGASFIVVKSFADAKKCAYLGELDSLEESDEISNEFEFTHYLEPENKSSSAIVMTSFSATTASSSIKNNNSVMPKKSTSQEFMGKHLNKIESWSEQSKTILLKKILDSLKNSHNDTMKFKAYQRENRDVQDYNDDKAYPMDLEDNGMEVKDIYDLHHNGEFNQMDTGGKIDRSMEEVRSSWSSSEEALASCEGLVYNVPLNGGKSCRMDASAEELNKDKLEVTLDIDHSGFYYFIFANENEITDNFISASFNLRKTVFDVSSNIANCTNSTSCEFPLSFLSEDHVVLEIPEENKNNDPCVDALPGFSSIEECHRIILAESVCKPRTEVYVIFLLMVPIFILLFANI